MQKGMITSNSQTRKAATNGRFGASGAVPRPKFCANFEVYRPSERQWKPRLRQAAGTLCASGAQKFRGTLTLLNLTVLLIVRFLPTVDSVEEDKSTKIRLQNITLNICY